MTDTVAPAVAADELEEALLDAAGLAVEGAAGPLGRLRAWTARRSRRRLAAYCVVTYCLLAVAAYLPVSPFESRSLPVAGIGNPAHSDPLQMTWFLAWVPFALTHGFSLFHTNYLDYPGGVNLADNTSVPLLGLLGWPVTATLGPIATFNFLVRLALAASGTSMFFAARRWCRSTIAPFLAGLLYMFGPYTAAQSLHIDLVFVALPPLLVLLADDLLRLQRRPPLLIGALIGLVAAFQYLISPDVLAGSIAIAAVALVGLGIRCHRELRRRLPYVLRALGPAVLVFGLLAGYPLFEMLAGPGHLRGPVVPEHALSSLSADLLGPFVPTSNQLVAPRFATNLANTFALGNLSENGTYLGIPLLAALAVSIGRLRRDPIVRTFAWLALAAFVISLGPRLVVGSRSTWFPLPEAIYTHLPLLDDTIPIRYSLYVLLFCSLIAGIAFDRLWLRRGRAAETLDPCASMPSRPIRRLVCTLRRVPTRVWAALAGLIVTVSLLPGVPFPSRSIPWPAALPGTISKYVEPGTVVLTYPFATPETAEALGWQSVDQMGFRLLGGYANIRQPGKPYGRRWPLLLAPRSVQEILGFSTFGYRYPPPPAPTRRIEDELPVYLDRYSVGAVVAWRTGRRTDALAETYLRAALGPPHVIGHGFAIWLPHDGSWTRR